MKVLDVRLMIGVASCVVFLSGCSSGGFSLGSSAGSGGGGMVAGGGSGDGSGGGGSNTGGTGGGGTGGGGTPGGGTPGGGTPGGGTPGGSTTTAGLGNGTVTVTAGGTTISTPPLDNNPVTGPVVTAVNGITPPLVSAGNAILTPVTNAVQPVTSNLPLTATVANASLGGAATQPIGLGVLSDNSVPGSVATVNLLSGGQAVNVSVTPDGLTNALAPATSGLPLTTTLGTQTLTGGTAQQPIGVSVLSPNQATGSAATVGALSGGNLATASITTPGGTSALTGGAASALSPVLSPVANATSPATSALPLSASVAGQTLTGGAAQQPIGVSVLSPTQSVGSAATVGVLSGGQLITATAVSPAGANPVVGGLSGVVSGTTSLANATVANQNLVTGASPLVGASVGSKTQNQGSLLTVGVGAAGQPLALGLGGKPLLPVR